MSYNCIFTKFIAHQKQKINFLYIAYFIHKKVLLQFEKNTELIQGKRYYIYLANTEKKQKKLSSILKCINTPLFVKNATP